MHALTPAPFYLNDTSRQAQAQQLTRSEGARLTPLSISVNSCVALLKDCFLRAVVKSKHITSVVLMQDTALLTRLHARARHIGILCAMG